MPQAHRCNLGHAARVARRVGSQQRDEHQQHHHSQVLEQQHAERGTPVPARAQRENTSSGGSSSSISTLAARCAHNACMQSTMLLLARACMLLRPQCAAAAHGRLALACAPRAPAAHLAAVLQHLDGDRRGAHRQRAAQDDGRRSRQVRQVDGKQRHTQQRQHHLRAGVQHGATRTAVRRARARQQCASSNRGSGGLLARSATGPSTVRARIARIARANARHDRPAPAQHSTAQHNPVRRTCAAPIPKTYLAMLCSRSRLSSRPMLKSRKTTPSSARCCTPCTSLMMLSACGPTSAPPICGARQAQHAAAAAAHGRVSSDAPLPLPLPLSCARLARTRHTHSTPAATPAATAPQPCCRLSPGSPARGCRQG